MTKKNLTELFEGTASNDLQGRVKQFRELKTQEQKLSQNLTELKKKREKFEEELTIAFENDGVQSINMLGHTFYVKRGLSASIPQKDRAEGHKWLRSIGAGSLIYPTVNANKFSAFVKERKDLGEDIPDFVQVYPLKGIGMRKSGGK